MQNTYFEYNSPWGTGFPGWHIECSGMVLKFLGEQIDIHTGGVDHINVHHTNEIAQSENFTGKVYSTFFCHNEFLDIGNEKMSKSLGNFFTLQTIVDENISPLSFRYLCLQSHYRQKMNFSVEGLKAAENALNKLKRQVLELGTKIGAGSPLFERGVGGDFVAGEHLNFPYLDKFTLELEEDLNTPQALATLWTLIKDENVSDTQKYFTIKKMDEVFSLDLFTLPPTTEDKKEITLEIQELIDKRNEFRKQKNFAEADLIRSKLNDLGFEILDK